MRRRRGRRSNDFFRVASRVTPVGRHESAASRQSCRSGHQVADVCQVTGKRCAAVIDRDGCRTAAFGFNRRSTAKSERQQPVCDGRLALTAQAADKEPFGLAQDTALVGEAPYLSPGDMLSGGHSSWAPC